MAADDSEETNETGGSLRARLEATQAENRELAKQLRPLLAARVIADKGFKYLSPEDLADVPLTEIEAKAASLNEAKAAVHQNVIRQVLADQGVAEADLDTAVQRLMNPDKQESHAETSTRLAGLGRIAGELPESDTAKGKHGRDLIEAGLQEKFDRNRKR